MDYTKFGAFRINDRNEAIEWVRNAFANVYNELIVDILNDNAVHELLCYIDSDTLHGITLAEILFEEDDHINDVVSIVKELLRVIGHPLSFGMIKEHVSKEHGYKITSSKWRTISKDLVKIGDRATAKWTIKEDK